MPAPRIAIIGAGFGGIAAANELKRLGFDDLVLLEQGAEPGGVWRDNTYPGAACDVPTPYYSYSYEPNPHWPRRYAEQLDAIVAERPAELACAHEPRRGECIDHHEHQIERIEQRNACPAAAVLREVRVEGPDPHYDDQRQGRERAHARDAFAVRQPHAGEREQAPADHEHLLDAERRQHGVDVVAEVEPLMQRAQQQRVEPQEHGRERGKVDRERMPRDAERLQPAQPRREPDEDQQLRDVERPLEAGRQEPGVGLAGVPVRAHRVDHPAGRQREARRGHRLADRQPALEGRLSQGAAGGEQLRACGSMDRAIDAASAQQRRVRRVHDGVDVRGGDVAEFA